MAQSLHMCKEETQSLDEVADLKIQARKERKKTEVEGEFKNNQF